MKVFVAEFAGMGTTVSQFIVAAIAGTDTVSSASRSGSGV
jgi:hypothetical protein